MGELSKLKGLGPKSERCLNDIGIKTRSELESIGPIRAFLRLRENSSTKPSLNFLYAMVGALEGKHWADIAKSEKRRLLMELEGYLDLEKILEEEGEDIGT
ncbi:MAG TPA: competence-specific regulator [Gammaproteobacteria bacterium]|nr:competence-specific regulator [Gammaproteobacteria bacterium]